MTMNQTNLEMIQMVRREINQMRRRKILMRTQIETTNKMRRKGRKTKEKMVMMMMEDGGQAQSVSKK